MAFNSHGGLTLVPMPGFEPLAEQLKELIEHRHNRPEDQETTVDIAIPQLGWRSNGEPLVRLGKKHIEGHDVVLLTSGPGTPVMLVQLLLVLGYLAGRKAERIAVMMGYFPLSRSDKDEGAVEFAFPRLIVDLMKTAAHGLLRRIISIDLHSEQIVMAGELGLITPVSLARRVLKRALEDAVGLGYNERICLLLPDDGAQKRYADVITQVSEETGMKLPVVVGQKKRADSRTSTLLGLSGDLESLPNALVIGFDDELATGKTNEDTARAVKEQFGAEKYWGAVVHGVLCENAPQLLASTGSPLDRVYISDSIPPNGRPELNGLISSGKIVVVSSPKDAAQIIYFHHWGIGIREMR